MYLINAKFTTKSADSGENTGFILTHYMYNSHNILGESH